MTLLEFALLWLAIGAALFLVEVLFSSRRQWSAMLRQVCAEVDLPPNMAGFVSMAGLAVVLALVAAALVTLAVWCLTWPIRLGSLFRGAP
jgi:hypothetical protein